MIYPKRDTKSRWLVILTGLLIFIWLGQEDNHTLPVTLLGIWSAGFSVIFISMGKLGGQQFHYRQLPLLGMLFGAISGISASLITAALMLFKNARHAHFLPDYPAGMMGDILERAPLWGLAGAFIGLGIALIQIAQHPPPNQ
ncbi:MAG: hypothetical protein Kow00117_02890 [Phototrophicales bacterium]